MTEHECCVHKTKKRDDAEVKRLINRLSRIEGQIRGIRKMVECDAYCIDILTQSAAASAATLHIMNIGITTMPHMTKPKRETRLPQWPPRTGMIVTFSK